MKIIVLDGYTLNPGDLSWAGMEALGKLDVYEHTAPEQIVERAAGYEIVITNKTPITRETIDALPDMKYIGLLATGYNVVDVDYARQKGIPVTNIPDYGTHSVAQMVFALLLELTNHVREHADAVRGGAWSRSRDFCFWNQPLTELAGKTMGIIGYGRIGQQVGVIAEAFGMNVLAGSFRPGRGAEQNGVRRVDIKTLLSESDVVSLHCPLMPETQGMLNRETLALMKPSAILINTSRGPLIVDEDLADALNRGIIAGAGLDVLAVEPPPIDNPLLSARNCIVTPHIAWATKEARSRLMDIATANVSAFLNGAPVNVVN
ncbi:D-2-hydroxyacid dehydrogenase [Paenibacillus gansuensis]|uniref:D-2-hydroxyacid dehydrogenase n=1 Tax=Paenibacillus gansuensis TaxID=306542 RepID=A0ABW5PHV1_9BACL